MQMKIIGSHKNLAFISPMFCSIFPAQTHLTEKREWAQRRPARVRFQNGSEMSFSSNTMV